MKNTKFVTKFVELLLVIMTMSLCSTAIAAEGMKAGRYIVTADKLILRDAQKNGEEICQIPRGEEVHVVRDCTSHEFMVPITWKDAYGYVSRDYLQIVENKEFVYEVPASNSSTAVTKDAVSQWPMTNLVGYAIDKVPVCNGDDKVLGSLEKGQEVIIAKLRRDFYVIQYGNGWHYVKASKIQITDANIPGEGKLYVVKENDNNIPVREEADKGSKILERLIPGWYVRLIEETEDGWMKVAFNEEGDEGYIQSRYLQGAEGSRVFRAKE